MTIEAIVTKSRYAWEGDTPHLGIHDTEQLTKELYFALAIIERWALVAAEPDGEDSAGRQRLMLPSEEALVARAFKIARLTFEHARRNGLVVSLPTMDEMREEVEARKAEA